MNRRRVWTAAAPVFGQFCPNTLIYATEHACPQRSIENREETRERVLRKCGSEDSVRANTTYTTPHTLHAVL